MVSLRQVHSSAEDRLRSFVGTVCSNEFVILIYSNTSLVFNVTWDLGFLHFPLISTLDVSYATSQYSSAVSPSQAISRLVFDYVTDRRGTVTAVFGCVWTRVTNALDLRKEELDPCFSDSGFVLIALGFAATSGQWHKKKGNDTVILSIASYRENMQYPQDLDCA